MGIKKFVVWCFKLNSYVKVIRCLDDPHSFIKARRGPAGKVIPQRAFGHDNFLREFSPAHVRGCECVLEEFLECGFHLFMRIVSKI